MPIRYTRQNHDVTATAGEEFIIALEANPTTGYQWEPEYNASLLRLIGREFSSTDAGIGSAADECFRWLALANGITSVRFTYGRTWDAVAADEVVFHIRIGG